MLKTDLQNRYQALNPDLVETWQMRRRRGTTRVATSVSLCVCLIIFGQSCWALEKNHPLKNALVATTPTIKKPLTSQFHNTL
jgi:hypothetical protein